MPKDVEPAALQRLLDLQQEDSAIRLLVHRRDTLPEAQRLSELKAQLAELDADIEIATKQLDEVAREQSRLEGEIGLLEAKIAKEEQRMYSGAISNPKELSALQAEVASLKRKRSTLEDSLLEVMVQKEDASETHSTLTTERATLATRSEELAAQVGALNGDIEAELATHEGARSEIVPDIPDDLMTLYDKLRVEKGGVGAAALRGGMCEGCHTKLPAKEIEAHRAAGGIQRCDNCRRILVVL